MTSTSAPDAVTRSGRLTRPGPDQWAALAGLAFVVLYVGAFALGIEVGTSDREILDYYADPGHRNRETAAFFLIAGAALALMLFGYGLRRRIDRANADTGLSALAGAGGVAAGTLILAGNAVSRAAAFAASSADFQLDPDTRQLFETAGFLLFVSGALAAILLVGAVSAAALRHRVFPRWLGWAGVLTALLLPLAIAFVGFLVFLVWVLAASAVLASRGAAPVLEPSRSRV